MLLIETKVARDVLNKEEQPSVSKAVQKAMVEEFKSIKGRTLSSLVL